ncbi:hypothetical protein BaRGS_00019259, partial [Batillaria attramentaria]
MHNETTEGVFEDPKKKKEKPQNIYSIPNAPLSSLNHAGMYLQARFTKVLISQTSRFVFISSFFCLSLQCRAQRTRPSNCTPRGWKEKGGGDLGGMGRGLDDMKIH